MRVSLTKMCLAVIVLCAGCFGYGLQLGAEPPAGSAPSSGGALVSETESPSAIHRSCVRSSFLQKGRLHSGFSEPEQKWIADNCHFGMPKALQGAAHGVVRIIVREGYVLAHSSEAKIPYWVCEHLTKDRMNGPGDRQLSKFLPDPLLAGYPRAELKDYAGSGYQRGHMEPAGDAKKTQKMMDETHFLSNIVPQYGPTFNQGIWAHLEDTVRQWATIRGESWVISGPMFYDPLEENEDTADGLIPYETVGVDEVAVPTHLFKIVLAKNRQGEWESIAFVFENRRYSSPYRLSLHRATVKWIEERTGYDFLPAWGNDPGKVALVDRLKAKKSEMWETE